MATKVCRKPVHGASKANTVSSDPSYHAIRLLGSPRNHTQTLLPDRLRGRQSSNGFRRREDDARRRLRPESLQHQEAYGARALCMQHVDGKVQSADGRMVEFDTLHDFDWQTDRCDAVPIERRGGLAA